MYDVPCVTKAMFRCDFFLFFWTSLYVVGIIATATLTLPARVVKGFGVPLVTCVHLFSISTVIAPQSQPNRDSAAALTSGSGPGSCFTFPSHMARSCWLHAFVSKVRRSWGRFLKWPKGLHIRQEARVYVYKTGLSGWPSHNQQTLCLLFTLLHCNLTKF